MQTLPVLPIPAAILSFDFDGTLHDPASDPSVPVEFFVMVRDLRVRRRVLWGINTGRSLGHLVEGMVESRFPFLPDWVVAREREIYLADRMGGWLPHAPWNTRCEREVHGLFQRAAKLLVRIRREVEENTGAQWMEWHGEPAGVIARTEEEMAWIVERVAPLAKEEPQLSWQRNSIWLRFGHADFHKGSSLSEVARIHMMPPKRCFAIGDSHNDLDMLDPAHAGMIACPANALEEIRVKVGKHGGFIATKAHGPGVLEALKHFFDKD